MTGEVAPSSRPGGGGPDREKARHGGRDSGSTTNLWCGLRVRAIAIRLGSDEPPGLSGCRHPAPIGWPRPSGGPEQRLKNAEARPARLDGAAGAGPYPVPTRLEWIGCGCGPWPIIGWREHLGGAVPAPKSTSRPILGVAVAVPTAPSIPNGACVRRHHGEPHREAIDTRWSVCVCRSRCPMSRGAAVPAGLAAGVPRGWVGSGLFHLFE